MLRLQLPPTPGATSADLQLPDLDPPDRLEPLLQLPRSCPAASVDLHPNSQSLLVVGADGIICVSQLEAAGQAAAAPWRAGDGWSSYAQGRWSDSHTFATVRVACHRPQSMLNLVRP